MTVLQNRVGTIEDVILREIKTITDERGFFREVGRTDNPYFQESFEQVDYSVLPNGAIKNWQIQPNWVEWLYVPIGVLKVTCYDARPASPSFDTLMEFRIGEGHTAMMAKIPAGVAVTFQSIAGKAYIFYVGSRSHSAQEAFQPFDGPPTDFAN